MSDSNAMSIMDSKEFWASDPAPGTVFFDLDTVSGELTGNEIDPHTEHPDNAVLVRYDTHSVGANLVAVLKWGDWSTPENQKIKQLRDKAASLMAAEEVMP